jgi:hypothetical protein
LQRAHAGRLQHDPFPEPALRRLCALVLLAGCSSAPPTHLFDDITEAVLPGESAIPTDPNDYACGDICVGTTFGVGAAAADVDGDGRADVYLAGPSGGRLYLNRTVPGGPIVLERAPLDVPDVYVHGAAFGDLDGDGLPELLLACAGGLRILWNQGGQLADRPALARTMQRSTSVTVADFDGDGMLDAHVSEYGVPGTPTAMAGPGALLISRGDGVLEDAATGWPGRHAWSSLAADLDRDGQLDLFIASETWGDFLDEQHASLDFGAGVDANGLPRFDDSANATLMKRYTAPMGAAIADLAGDGTYQMVATLIGPSLFLSPGADPRTFAGSSYFGNTSREQSGQTSWGALFGDFDRDGEQELLLVGGAPCTPDICDTMTIPDYQAPQLFKIVGTQLGWDTLHAIPLAGGLAPDPTEQRNGRGVVAVDLDGDGVDELLITPFGDRFRLYKSALAGGHRVRVVLHGHLSAPTPWGAEVTVRDGDRTRHVPLTSGGSTHSQSEAAITVELAGDRASEVTIRWPSGLTQTLKDVPSGRLDVDEPIALDLQRRAPVGAPLIGTLTLVGALDPDTLAVSASDGATMQLDRVANNQLRFTHPGATSPGVVTFSFTLAGTPLSITPRVTAF